jgi:hypothetical protein
MACLELRNQRDFIILKMIRPDGTGCLHWIPFILYITFLLHSSDKLVTSAEHHWQFHNPQRQSQGKALGQSRQWRCFMKVQ